ncbi:MAG TPA: hypothetical protein VGE39_12940 [Prosthecobacter sp.]
MVLEQHPYLHSLSPEDKLPLSEELCMDALLDAQRNPALRDRVNQRLQDYRDDPDSGMSWDEVKQRILARKKIA